MTEYFSTISEGDFSKLKDAIPLITLLIGGADGELDKDEVAWAEKVTKIRSYKMSKDLIGFYQEVGADFSTKLDTFYNDLPKSVEDRTKIIATRLEALNPILASLDQLVAYHLYKSYLSFAKHVAKASGGIFGFFSVGPHEGELIDLPMIAPIERPEELEEEE